MTVPFWPFTVSFVVRIDEEDMPTDMFVYGKDHFDTIWEWGFRLPKHYTVDGLGRYFGQAMAAYQRVADLREKRA